MSNRIREIRLSRGLSQDELAERAGTTKAQISKLENSLRRLTEDWMQRIAKGLDCRPSELLEEFPAPLSSDEQEVLNLYRVLAEQDRAAVRHIIESMALTHRK